MRNFIQLGAMAVQFLAEGALIERGGEFFTVAFVDDNFAYSRDLSDAGQFDVFMRDEAGIMCKFTARRDTMIPLMEEVTERELEASIGG